MSIFQKYMGYTPRRLVFLCAYSATTGMCVGKVFLNLKKNPGTGVKIMKKSLASGIVVGTFGLTYGILIRKKAIRFFFSQTIYATLVTLTYLNIRSVINNLEYHVPLGNDNIRMNDLSVSTVSGGITGTLIALIMAQRIAICATGATFGLFTGFFGHLIYDRVCAVRLKLLLEKQYPDLVSKHSECEEWITQESLSNPDYTGPIKSEPYILELLDSLWGEYSTTKKTRLISNPIDIELPS